MEYQVFEMYFLQCISMHEEGSEYNQLLDNTQTKDFKQIQTLLKEWEQREYNQLFH